MIKYVILALILIQVPVFAQSDVQFQSILSRSDLSGWVIPENNLWWSVQDGVLSVSNDPGLQGSILWTDKSYEDFIIKGDFKFGKGKVDSGFFIRNENDQIQIGISGSLKRDMTCSPYIPGKGYPIEATGVQDLLKPDDWNSIKVKAEGNQYTAWLNGVEVMQYTSDTATESGPVGIQLHAGNEMSIDFRNLMVAEL